MTLGPLFPVVNATIFSEVEEQFGQIGMTIMVTANTSCYPTGLLLCITHSNYILRV